MKNIFLVLLAIGFVANTVSFVPVLTKPSKSNAAKQLSTNALPDDVKAIIEKSCIGCHGEGGSRMAMSKLNFSKWDSYPAKKQTAKAAAICKKVTNGKMPPSSVRKSKPELIPTQAQIDLICNWSKTLGK